VSHSPPGRYKSLITAQVNAERTLALDHCHVPRSGEPPACLAVRSAPGQGTTVEIVLPVTVGSPGVVAGP